MVFGGQRPKSGGRARAAASDTPWLWLTAFEGLLWCKKSGTLGLSIHKLLDCSCKKEETNGNSYTLYLDRNAWHYMNSTCRSLFGSQEILRGALQELSKVPFARSAAPHMSPLQRQIRWRAHFFPSITLNQPILFNTPPWLQCVMLQHKLHELSHIPPRREGKWDLCRAKVRRITHWESIAKCYR